MDGSYRLSEALRRWLERKITSEHRIQAGIARDLGVKQQRFNHWLSGHAKIPLDKVNDIALLFHFPDDAALINEVRTIFPAVTKEPPKEEPPARRPREGIWPR